MTIPPLFGHWYDGITGHRYYLFSLIISFFLILIGYFITWPVVGYDTDLWYHLSGGRYFWQNGTIPKDAFFSYITPPKSWYDYYWLFQVIVYKIFQFTGYYGLIVLRCLLYFLTTLFICLFFVNRRESRIGLLIGLFVFICYPIALAFREVLVRPYLFSFLFIVVFLYILELKRDKIWLLPFLGILWCNIHGYEYPVMMLIVLAYLAEMLYHNLKKTLPKPGEGKLSRWMLILTLYTVFITPNIIELIQTPFHISYGNALYQQLYVSELIPLQLSSLFSFSIFPLLNLLASLRNGLVLFSLGCFMICLYKREVRISHLILFFASIVLLIKYNRFIYEFILLSIPMTRHGLALLVKPLENRKGIFHRIAPGAMIVILIIIPFLMYGAQFKNRPEYPFTQLNLPVGVVKFLNERNAGGSILNDPNTGGYLQWALNRKYKIYMDMGLAIFNDRDFAYVNNALSDENTFRSFIGKYDPSFISVALKRSYFPNFIRQFKDFRLVFFDDTEALYVNAKHFKHIAESYELKHIDPFQYISINYDSETKERLSLILDEAMKLRNLYPDCLITNAIIANILIVDKQYEQTLPYVDNIILRYPDVTNGYALKADALFGLGRFKDAAALYRTAIDKGNMVNMDHVHFLYTAYIRLNEHKEAYRVLSGAINPFNSGARYQDIYKLGMSAAAAGKVRDAVNFLKIA
ncbi:hypothetical protein KJ909_04330, partial [Patescibacteria group bacterium]|nr:hypothetical protein [Patescibacteria group bacterium]